MAAIPSDSDDDLAPDVCVVGEAVPGGTSKGKKRRREATSSERRQSALRKPGPAAANMNDWPEFYYGELGEHTHWLNNVVDRWVLADIVQKTPPIARAGPRLSW